MKLTPSNRIRLFSHFARHITFLASALALAVLGSPELEASNTESVAHLELAPQEDGTVRVSWDAPEGESGDFVYLIKLSGDLSTWVTVVEPQIDFSEARAVWVDDGSIPLGSNDGIEKRFYRIYEISPIELERIEQRFGAPMDVPEAVIYTRILAPFEASDETMERYLERLELSQRQGLSHVLGHYIVQFEDDVFAFAIDCPDRDAVQLVTVGGVALQTLAEELVESGGGELIAVWESAVEGFSAYLPPALVDELQASDQIKLVEADGIGSYDE